MRKTIASLLILLFLTSLVAFPSVTVKAESKTIIVPNNYPTIASAIGNAMNGDKILVKSGTYNESAINTDKSLSIIGDGYQSTIINLKSSSHEIVIDVLGHTATFCDPAMTINANDFALSGLTLKSNGGDISLNGNGMQVIKNKIETTCGMSGSNLYVAGNIFSKIGFSANFSRISENFITSGLGLSGQYSIFSSNSITNEAPSIETYNCLITGNTIYNASFAIFPLDGRSNIFSHNAIDHLAIGLWVRGSNNTVMLNQITHCGVALQPSPNNTYYSNNIANNLWGVDTVGSLLNPDGNSVTFFNNNMKDNTYQVTTLFASKQEFFDNGKEGNYWSDYRGTDLNGDGVVDTPYVIDSNRLDRYPLIAPFNISKVPDLIPEWALAPNVRLINPSNGTYSSRNITLDFAIDKQVSWIGYSLDGLTNTTITGNITLTDLGSGAHNISVYANDWYQNTCASQTISFSISELESFSSSIIFAGSAVAVIIGVVVVTGLLVYFKKHKRVKIL
jgi:nitrous oxidase accessory protein